MLSRPRYFDDGIWGTETWPLLSACYSGDIRIVTRMLDKDPSCVRAQFAYYEPLHYAVRGGHSNVTQLLLDRGGDPRAEGWTRLGQDTPISKATDRERHDLQIMLEHAAATLQPRQPLPEKPRSPEQQLHRDFEIACGKNDRKYVEKALADHPHLATFGLYEAVHQKHTELARFLIEAGANVNGHMPWACWFTPLMHAVRYEPQWDLAQLLLDSGVSVNGMNGLGMTPLHITVLQNRTAAMEWLLDHGAHIDAIDEEFCSTPLGWAARWGRSEAATMLLQRGANVLLPEETPWAQPERWAAKKGNHEILTILGSRE